MAAASRTGFLHTLLVLEQEILTYPLRRQAAVKVCLGLLVKSIQILFPSLLEEISLSAQTLWPSRSRVTFIPENIANKGKSGNAEHSTSPRAQAGYKR